MDILLTMYAKLKRIFQYLSSLKLALLLILLFIVMLMPATFIKQGESYAFYESLYGSALAELILRTSYHQFYSSIPFLTIVSLFWLNLFCCTLQRFIRQLKKARFRRFGPDLLHAGLLILIAAMLFSSLTRHEMLVYLAPGDALALGDQQFLRLDDFDFYVYADGRPYNWVSHISLVSVDGERIDSWKISPNKPLRMDKLVLYQATYHFNEERDAFDTGLKLVYQEGRWLIILGLFILITGVSLVFLQRKKE